MLSVADMNMTDLTIKLDRRIIIHLLLLPFWFLIYHFLKPAADWLIDDALHLNAGTRFTEALRFFVFEVPKVLLLLTLIIFLVGIVRSYFSPEKTRKVLEGNHFSPGISWLHCLALSPLSVPVPPFRSSWDLWRRGSILGLPSRSSLHHL